MRESTMCRTHLENKISQAIWTRLDGLMNSKSQAEYPSSCQWRIWISNTTDIRVNAIRKEKRIVGWLVGAPIDLV